MIEKVKSMAEKANTFFAEAGPQLSVTGQQFLAGLSILCILLSLLFFKNMFLPAMVLEFVSLVWYMFTGQSAPEMAGKAGLWSKINLYLNICLLVLVPYSWIAKAAGGGGGAALVGMAFMAVGAAGLTVFQMSDMGKGMWTKLAEVGTKMGKGEDPAYKPGALPLHRRVPDLFDAWFLRHADSGPFLPRGLAPGDSGSCPNRYGRRPGWQELRGTGLYQRP